MRDFRVLFIIMTSFMGCSPEVVVQMPPELAEKMSGGGIEQMLPIILQAMDNMGGDDQAPQPVPQENTPQTPGPAAETKPEVEKPATTPVIVSVSPPTDPCEGFSKWQDEILKFPYHAVGHTITASASFLDGNFAVATIEKCNPHQVTVTYTKFTGGTGEITFYPLKWGYDNFTATYRTIEDELELIFEVKDGNLEYVFTHDGTFGNSYETYDVAFDGFDIASLPKGPFGSALLKLALKDGMPLDTDGLTGAQDTQTCTQMLNYNITDLSTDWPEANLWVQESMCESSVTVFDGNTIIVAKLAEAGSPTAYEWYEEYTYDDLDREIGFSYFLPVADGSGYFEHNFTQTTYESDTSENRKVFDGVKTLDYQVNEVKLESGSIGRHTNVYVRWSDNTSRMLYGQYHLDGVQFSQVEYAPRASCTSPLDCTYQTDQNAVLNTPLIEFRFISDPGKRMREIKVYDGPTAVTFKNPTETFTQYFVDVELKFMIEEYAYYARATDSALEGPLYMYDNKMFDTKEPVQGYEVVNVYDESGEKIVRTTEYSLAGEEQSKLRFEYGVFGPY